jgi:hypothetical protein
MQDDPFARAVERVEAAEQAQAASRHRRRRERVLSTSRTAFRIHATVYVVTNLMLIAIWATTTAGYPWFLWPLLGWGIGLAAHFAAVKDQLRRPAPAPEAENDGASAPAPSTVAELVRLTDLHRSGALNDEEFVAAKAKLLQ